MKDQIVSLLQAQENSESYDFTNAVTTEKTYDGTRFLITSGIKQGTIDLDIAYAETDGGVFVVSIAKTGGLINEADRDELYSDGYQAMAYLLAAVLIMESGLFFKKEKLIKKGEIEECVA